MYWNSLHYVICKISDDQYHETKCFDSIKTDSNESVNHFLNSLIKTNIANELDLPVLRTCLSPQFA